MSVLMSTQLWVLAGFTHLLAVLVGAAAMAIWVIGSRAIDEWEGDRHPSLEAHPGRAIRNIEDWR